MNKARISFPDLFLCKSETRLEQTRLGKRFTIFGLPSLLDHLGKPLYYLFGREREDRVEGFFICCSPADLEAIMQGFRANRWLNQFMDQKNVQVREAKTLL